MTWTLVSTFAFLLAIVVAFGNRERIGRFLRRIDDAIIQRRHDFERDLKDPLSHYYLTVQEIEGRTPAPTRIETRDAATGVVTTHVIWNGEEFAGEEEAGEARRAFVLAEARAFYETIDGGRRAVRRRPDGGDEPRRLTGGGGTVH